MLTDEEHASLDEAVSNNPLLASLCLDDVRFAASLLVLVLNGAREAYKRHDDPIETPSQPEKVLEEHTQLWETLKDAYIKQQYAPIREHGTVPFCHNDVYRF
jgi:hypothetical protein